MVVLDPAGPGHRKRVCSAAAGRGSRLLGTLATLRGSDLVFKSR